MSQSRPAPHRHYFGRCIQDRPHDAVALFGSRKRCHEIVLGSQLQGISDASKQTVHLSICTEAVKVQNWKGRRLRQQLFVGHDDWSPSGKNRHLSTVANLTQTDSTESDKNFCRIGAELFQKSAVLS